MAAPKPASKPKAIATCPKTALALQSEPIFGEGRGAYYARVPADHSVEDVLNAAYFGAWQGPRDPRPGDLIDIEPESAEWLLQVRVMDRTQEPQLMFVRQQVFQDFRVEVPTGYRLIWNGQNAKWKIWKGDHEIDAELPGYATQDQCLARIEELRRDKAAA